MKANARAVEAGQEWPSPTFSDASGSQTGLSLTDAMERSTSPSLNDGSERSMSTDSSSSPDRDGSQSNGNNVILSHATQWQWAIIVRYLLTLLRRQPGGRVKLSTIGINIRRRFPGFELKTYGFKKFKDAMNAISELECVTNIKSGREYVELKDKSGVVAMPVNANVPRLRSWNNRQRRRSVLGSLSVNQGNPQVQGKQIPGRLPVRLVNAVPAPYYATVPQQPIMTAHPNLQQLKQQQPQQQGFIKYPGPRPSYTAPTYHAVRPMTVCPCCHSVQQHQHGQIYNPSAQWVATQPVARVTIPSSGLVGRIASWQPY